MDLVPRTQNVPSATKGYRDQNAALARDLAPIAQITGQPVTPKTLRGDYLNLEVDRTHLSIISVRLHAASCCNSKCGWMPRSRR